MKTFVVYVDGHEQAEPIAAEDYYKAMMIAEAKYPSRRVQVYLSVMGWHWFNFWYSTRMKYNVAVHEQKKEAVNASCHAEALRLAKAKHERGHVMVSLCLEANPKVKIKYYEFSTYEMGCGAECLSGVTTRYSFGDTLAEAKAMLVNIVGCTDTYFDDPAYTTVKEITEKEFRDKSEI